MDKKSIKKNYIYNLFYQVLLLVTPLITTPYVSRVLGADKIGEVSYTESVVSYFVMFATMGITTYGQREISYVQDSKEKRSKIFWNTKILEFFTSFCLLVAFLIFAYFHKNKFVYFIFSFNIIAVFIDVTWFFQGMEEFIKIALRNIIFKLINIIYIFVFVKSSNDTLLYVFGICFFSFLANVPLWACLPMYIGRINKKDIHPFKELPVVISLFIPTVAIQVYTMLDKTMIGIITKDSFENGYYEQALKIYKTILTVVTALGTVMIPRIGYYFEQKKDEEVKKLMYQAYKFVWFLGIPMCLGLVITAENFVPWFLGIGYYKTAMLIKILSLLIIVIGINNVTGMQYLIPTKRQNIFTFTVITGACTNFLLNLVLIRIYQSMGAAVASVVAETVIAVIQLIIVRKELNPYKILKEGINYYISGAVMAIVLWYVAGKLLPSVFNTFLMVFCGGIIYFIMLVILKDEFFIFNMKSILEKIKDKMNI